jgi:hypothetical protein
MRVRAGAVLIHAALGLAIFGLGCEREDELGPYVQKLGEVDTYNAKLVEYRFFLKSDQPQKAATLEETIQEYLAHLETFGHTRDKVIMAGHNALKRKLGTSLKKIVEPDFPTFTISALKQIDIIREGYIIQVEMLQKRWKKEERTGEFTLSWPGEE